MNYLDKKIFKLKKKIKCNELIKKKKNVLKKNIIFLKFKISIISIVNYNLIFINKLGNI